MLCTSHQVRCLEFQDRSRLASEASSAPAPLGSLTHARCLHRPSPGARALRLPRFRDAASRLARLPPPTRWAARPGAWQPRDDVTARADAAGFAWAWGRSWGEGGGVGNSGPRLTERCLLLRFGLPWNSSGPAVDPRGRVASSISLCPCNVGD